jgi:glycosyltransferase involved in cell wall biosynthesis
MPTISVIIPAYNAAQTIGDSIQSVLAQTYDDYEIIIVNDASPDNLDSLLNSFTSPKIKRITHPHNQGASAARNSGIQAATGKYIAFLDSDDIWFPHKLETQLAFMENNPDKTMKASCSSFTFKKLNGRTSTRTLQSSKNWNKILLGGCNVSPGSTMICERSLFSEIGLYPEELKRLEDWDWLLTYIKDHTLGVIEEPLAEIRASGYPAYKTVKDSAQILYDRKQIYIVETFGTSSLRIFKSGLQIEKASAAIKNKHYLKGLYHLTCATLYSPRKLIEALKRIIK